MWLICSFNVRREFRIDLAKLILLDLVEYNDENSTNWCLWASFWHHVTSSVLIDRAYCWCHSWCGTFCVWHPWLLRPIPLAYCLLNWIVHLFYPTSACHLPLVAFNQRKVHSCLCVGGLFNFDQIWWNIFVQKHTVYLGPMYKVTSASVAVPKLDLGHSVACALHSNCHFNSEHHSAKCHLHFDLLNRFWILIFFHKVTMSILTAVNFNLFWI